jgi:hypothetical protein
LNPVQLPNRPKLGKLRRTLKNVRFGGFFAFFDFLNWIPIGFLEFTSNCEVAPEQSCLCAKFNYSFKDENAHRHRLNDLSDAK